jgi:hypothetical protein
VPKGFKGDIHVRGSWKKLEFHGEGNVTIGEGQAEVRKSFGLALNEQLPAAAYKLDDFLVLFGTDAASYTMEIGASKSRR